MKKVILSSLMLLCAISTVFSQINSNPLSISRSSIVSPVVNRNYGKAIDPSLKNAPGLRMKNVGRTLTLAGSLLFVGGIAVISQADKTTTTTYSGGYYYSDEPDPDIAIGAAMISGGLGMAIPGIIFWSKGNKKYNRWIEEQRQKNLSLGINRSGVGLSLRF